MTLTMRGAVELPSRSSTGVDVSVGMPLRWDPFGRDGVRRQEVKGDWCALQIHWVGFSADVSFFLIFF